MRDTSRSIASIAARIDAVLGMIARAGSGAAPRGTNGESGTSR